METLGDPKLKEVKDVTKRFLTTLRGGDAVEFFSFLDNEYIGDDTELITPSGEFVRGEQLMPFYHEFFDPLFESFDADGGFYNEEYTVVGHLAVHKYSYKLILKPKDGGELVTEIGHGIKTYKKYHDGSWRLQYDIWVNPE